MEILIALRIVLSLTVTFLLILFLPFSERRRRRDEQIKRNRGIYSDLGDFQPFREIEDKLYDFFQNLFK